MSSPEHRVLRESLGAYALGQLPPAEAAEVETHLAACSACRAELAELRPAVEALALARSSAEPVPAPSADIAARIDASIRAESGSAARSRAVRTGAIAMLSAAAAAVALVVALRVSAPDAAPRVPLEAVGVVQQAPGVTATANLVNHTWGVEVKLQASGFRAGDRYLVSMVDKAGIAYPAGAFVGTGDKPMLCNLTSPLLRREAAGFVVKDVRGAVVLRSDFVAV